MKLNLLLLGIILCALLSSCDSTTSPTVTMTTISSATSTPRAYVTPTPSVTPIEIIPGTDLSPEDVVFLRASEVLQALLDRDMEMLAKLSHPNKGVRFTPYAYVQDIDLVFHPNQLVGILSDSTVYAWGTFDGSGLPIELTFEGYYERFVYDHDYLYAEKIGFNERIGQGNSIDNSLEYYVGANVVEYHFSGFNPDYGGMDWRSLRLVFIKEDSDWYLVGIIHDEWTI